MDDLRTQASLPEPESIDLLIIGAGPAGLSLALHLLQADPSWSGRMLLLEKAAHPRPKLCGGGVTRLGIQVLQDLGMPFPLPLPQARVDDVRLVYAGRTVHVRGKPQFLIFNRAEFDAYLAEQVCRRGAVIRQNEPVTSLAVDENGATVTTSAGMYRAKALAGADGSKGIVRKTLSRFDKRTRVARLLEVLNPARETAPQFTERFALFDFTPAAGDLQGYFWDFPSRVDGRPVFNRGVYDSRVSQARARSDLPGVLQRALQPIGVHPEELHIAGHPIHWFSPRSRLSMPRLLLVGDAAGADPLFGEGIGPALGYGRAAAQAVQYAFATGDFSFGDYRRRLFQSPVGRYLLVRWAIAWWSYRLSRYPWYMHWMWTLGKVLNRLWPDPPSLYLD